MDYIFYNSSCPSERGQEKSELPQSLLEAKLYLLRQRALESRESFGDTSKIMTGVIQNNKYIAFKGIINGVLSFPISGCINIESNIMSPVLKCGFSKDVVDGKRGCPEMVIIPPEAFD
jgi:hypothetical protein